MNQITAEQIARKVRAFKHADKLCKEIEKKGKVMIAFIVPIPMYSKWKK